MNKIKKVHPNGFYIFCGKANANSCFIEKISHAKQFLIYANYFLKSHLTIYDYVINRDGWTIVVKIKRSNKNIANDAVWKVISERMRLFLCTFVRVTNRQKGRTGCLVHSSYERYYFETLKEAMSCIEKIRNQNIKNFAGKKKYRGLKSHYKISPKMGKGSVFLCSKELRKVKRKFFKKLEVFNFIDLKKVVVQKMINHTLTYHNQHLKPLTI